MFAEVAARAGLTRGSKMKSLAARGFCGVDLRSPSYGPGPSERVGIDVTNH